MIGVLALQGGFAEHQQILWTGCQHTAIQVKNAHDLNRLNGLIIPGGESTTMMRLLQLNTPLYHALIRKIRDGMAVWGTCAGMILLSENGLGLMSIQVERNAYGPQSHSFHAEVALMGDQKPFKGVFIRAPKIQSMGHANTIAMLEGTPVGVRQGHMMATSFHPELTHDARLHQYFLKMTHASI